MNPLFSMTNLSQLLKGFIKFLDQLMKNIVKGLVNQHVIVQDDHIHQLMITAITLTMTLSSSKQHYNMLFLILT